MQATNGLLGAVVATAILAPLAGREGVEWRLLRRG